MRRSHASVWAGAFTFATLLAVGVPAPARGECGVEEARIKAAIVYNFTKFVHWPPIPLGLEGEFALGVVGENNMRAALEKLQGKSVGEDSLRVQKIETPEDLTHCRVVFFSHSCAERVPQLLAALEDSPVLTVSDIEGFGRSGGMIELVRRRNKIRFLINPDAASRADLRLSSQLLKMAQLVERGD